MPNAELFQIVFGRVELSHHYIWEMFAPCSLGLSASNYVKNSWCLQHRRYFVPQFWFSWKPVININSSIKVFIFTLSINQLVLTNMSGGSWNVAQCVSCWIWSINGHNYKKSRIVQVRLCIWYEKVFDLSASIAEIKHSLWRLFGLEVMK